MPNILMTRIDNRLVHGQVGVTWTNTLGANLVVVANDEAAADPVQQNLMDMVVAEGVQTRYFTLQKTIDVIHKAADRQKIFLVCKTPQDVLTLVRGGVPIRFVNVGNMHFAEGKRQVHKRCRWTTATWPRFARWRRWAWSAKCAGCRMRRARRSANCSFEPGESMLTDALLIALLAGLAGLTCSTA